MLTEGHPVAAPAEPVTAGPPRRVRVDAYAVVGAVLVLFCLAVALRTPFIGDFGVHAGTLERLRQHLWQPGNPLVADDGPSSYYTPYSVVLGVLARLTGLTGVTVLILVTPLNVVLLLVGVRR